MAFPVDSGAGIGRVKLPGRRRMQQAGRVPSGLAYDLELAIRMGLPLAALDRAVGGAGSTARPEVPPAN